MKQMETKQSKRSSQSGEIMLEASIVFVPVLILLMALLSLGFWFYEMAIMTNVASEIAAEVARNYKFESLAAYGDTLDLNDVAGLTKSVPGLTGNNEGLRRFRSTFGKSKLENTQNNRAQAHADWRIPLSTLGLGSQTIKATAELKRSGIGRIYVKVTVRHETDFFLSNILQLAGIVEDHPVFGGTAYAECIDLMEYTSMTNFLRYGMEKFSVFSSFGKLYKEVKGLLQSNLFQSLGIT